MAELQKDPMTRGDFLGFGLMGTIMGAVLTIPPLAFILTPIVKTDILGESDVGDVWREVGSVSEVPKDVAAGKYGSRLNLWDWDRR